MTAIASEPHVTLDLSALTGTWKNTNTASVGVARFDIAAAGDGLLISAHATESWGTAAGHAYSADGFDARHALAFNATFDLGFASVRLQANIKAGVLVVAFLKRFNDDSGRSNVFTREFYYRSVA
jgi:hypothetical protein